MGPPPVSAKSAVWGPLLDSLGHLFGSLRSLVDPLGPFSSSSRSAFDSLVLLSSSSRSLFGSLGGPLVAVKALFFGTSVQFSGGLCSVLWDLCSALWNLCWTLWEFCCAVCGRCSALCGDCSAVCSLWSLAMTLSRQRSEFASQPLSCLSLPPSHASF